MGGAYGFTGRIPEANFQAEFYHQCRLIGLKCLLEYKTPAGRHDVCVFNEDFTELLAIVECKNNKSGIVDKTSVQISKYRKVGVPIYDLCSMAAAENLAKKIAADLQGKRGVSVEQVQLLEPHRRRKRRGHRVSYIDLDEDLIIRA